MKKILLVACIIAMLVCLFAISVSAETVLKPQDNNAYGDLSFFDESVTVGRTNTKYGYTPYINAEKTILARIVVGDGTTYYTFPTAYALSNSSIYGVDERSIYAMDLKSLNTAMEGATGTNPGWTYKNIYRIELPYNMNLLNGGNNQAFKEYSNVIEIYLQPNTTTKDKDKQMLLFWNCKNVEVIHNLDTFVFREGTTGGAFQNDAKLTNITLGVSTEVTKTQDSMFSGCTALQSVNLKEAFPNMTNIGNTCFYQCTNLVSTSSEENAVSLPSKVTTINQQAFYECKAMKYLSLPTTLTYVGAAAFRDSKALEFIDFNDNTNNIEFYNYGHFMGCSSLKAVSLSDNVTILNNRIFASCTSLQAVYLPKNLVQMNTNGNGQGPFCYDANLYFVNEPFEVRDENGKFLGESFVMPSKPEVYFMPNTLSSADGNVSSGTWFRECISLNTTIVMPKVFTNSTVVQMFRETANASNIKNVVYLGDMETIAWSERNHHINFVFANPNDKDINSFTFSSFYNNLNSNCYFYFCSTGYKYTVGVAQDKIAGTLETNAYHHVANPNKTESVPADCVNNATATTYCFCTVKIGTSDVENSALGHEYDLAKGAVKSSVEYANYLANGILKIKCARCTECQENKVNPIITEFKGFSVSEKGDAITFGYTFDNAAISEFEEVNSCKVELGFVVAVKAFAGDDAYTSDKAIKAAVTDEKAQYTGADFILRGTWDKMVDLDGDGTEETNVKNVEFYMAGYILVNGAVTYLNYGASGATADTVTFANANSTEA